MPAIAVQLLGDSRSLERAFIRGGASADAFGAKMARTAKISEASRGALSQFGGKTSFLFGSTSFVAAAGIAAIIDKSTKSAIDLQKQIERTDAVFGQSAEDIKKWAETTAASIGISREQALQAAGSFGTLFHTIRLTPAVADQMSKRLVTLAADLAAFNHASPDATLNALRQGLLGNTRGLKQFNVAVSAAQVNQQALADTGKKTVTSLTTQDRVLARYKIILSQTAIATGAFKDHQKDAAEQGQILKANISDLADQLGQTLLPIITAATIDLNKFIEAAKKLPHIKLPFGAKIPSFPHIPFEVPGQDQIKRGLKDLVVPGALLKDLAGANKSLDDTNHLVSATSDNLKGARSNADDLASALSAAAGAASDLEKASNAVRTATFAQLTAQANNAPLATQIKLQKQLVQADKAVTAATASGSKKRRAALEKEISDQGTLASLQGQAASNNADAARKIQAAADKRSQAEQNAIQRSFQKFDIKLSKTQLTPKFKDDLVVLTKELAVVRDLESKHKSDLDLQQRELDIRGQIVGLQQQQADQVKQQLADAKSQAQQLFGNLFQAPDLTAAAPTFLGGSRGRKIVPGTGGSASDLLANITSQNKAFATLTQNIATLAKRGAPASLLEAARSGQLTSAQVSALAHAQSSVLNKIFAQTRRADKLITKVAKAEINANQATVNIGKLQTAGVGTDRGTSHEQPLKIQVYLDGKKIEESLERRAKKRAPQRRGRTGGKR